MPASFEGPQFPSFSLHALRSSGILQIKQIFQSLILGGAIDEARRKELSYNTS